MNGGGGPNFICAGLNAFWGAVDWASRMAALAHRVKRIVRFIGLSSPWWKRFGKRWHIYTANRLGLPEAQ